MWYYSIPSAQVHVTLTSDQNKIFKALQSLEPKGSINFITSLRIAHVSIVQTYHTHQMYNGVLSALFSVCVLFCVEQLALKHRQNKNQKMKIVAFIGSPLTIPDKEVGLKVHNSTYSI